MNNGKWIKEDSGAEGIETVLDGWITATENYCQFTQGKDVPYFYNERANVSVLAAGAWIAGGIALEEYQASKTREDISSSGRCDLYVCTEGGFEYEIEAKYLYNHYLKVGVQFESALKQKMDAAIKDAKALETSAALKRAGLKRAGCVFYLLGVDKSRYASTDSLNPQYSELVERHKKALKNIGCDAIAWCTPEVARRFRPYNDDQFFFGVVVALTLIP